VADGIGADAATAQYADVSLIEAGLRDCLNDLGTGIHPAPDAFGDEEKHAVVLTGG